ncbi:hypothetical protein CsSME_00045932 [Camellia sinensis var. sinensis]
MDFEIQSDFEAPSPPSSAPASTPYLSLSLSLFWKFILMASETLEDKKQEEIANVEDKGEVKEEGKTEEGEEEKEAEKKEEDTEMAEKEEEDEEKEEPEVKGEESKEEEGEERPKG